MADQRMMFVSVALALLLDRVVGEPRRWHPLCGFGNLAVWIEQRVNRRDESVTWSILAGAACWACLVLPLPLLLWQLPDSSWMHGPLAIVALWFSIGWKSLREHGLAVAEAFERLGLDAARAAVSRIVSRDTDKMDESAVARATIESLLENGSDAIFAPLFWFLVLGPAGAIGYRFANTLDAMWGYRSERFEYFGKFSARADDVLNWIPARLTAMAYALMGNGPQALRCWREQAVDCASPNGGVVMCSGAGALNVELGGGAWYRGEWQVRPVMGCGRSASLGDVSATVQLLDRTVYLWLGVIALLSWVVL